MKKFIVLSTISLFVFAIIATLTLNLAQVKGQTSDPGGSGGGVSLSGGCKPTAAAPTYSEGVANYLSCLLDGSLRIYHQYLGWGEDPDNDLLKTSGGKVRVTNLMTNVSTNTTSATQILPVGEKTIQATLVCNAGGSTNCGITFIIYGYRLNATTIGEPLCEATIPTGLATAIATCDTFRANFLFYWASTSGVAGTSPALTVDAMY